MAKAGRKGKYHEWLTPDGLMRVEGWARDGLSDKQICHNMEIGQDSFYKWKARFPEFAEALKRGKAPVDHEVENALLASALGHVQKVKKAIKLKTKRQLKDKGTIEEERVEFVEEEVYIPPQVAAQIFWLKNRKPQCWRDRQDHVINDMEDLKPLADMINE